MLLSTLSTIVHMLLEEFRISLKSSLSTRSVSARVKSRRLILGLELESHKK